MNKGRGHAPSSVYRGSVPGTVGLACSLGEISYGFRIWKLKEVKDVSRVNFGEVTEW